MKKENEEVFCFPWRRYLTIFIILNLFFIIFDPAGKDWYLFHRHPLLGVPVLTKPDRPSRLILFSFLVYYQF